MNYLDRPVAWMGLELPLLPVYSVGEAALQVREWKEVALQRWKR